MLTTYATALTTSPSKPNPQPALSLSPYDWLQNSSALKEALCKVGHRKKEGGRERGRIKSGGGGGKEGEREREHCS